MNGDLGVELMNYNNLKLKWNPGKKRRSLRKSSGRRSNSASKLGDLDSPKFREALSWQASSSMLGSIPIKKRRHLLCMNSVPQCSSTSFEENVQAHPPGMAAAASMDDESRNVNKEMLPDEGSSLKLMTSDASFGVLPPESCLKCNESGDSSSKMIEKESNHVDVLSKTSNRKHWDLNILMDAWDEPCDSVAASKDSGDDVDTPTVAVASNGTNASADTSPGTCNFKLNENNSAISSPDKGHIDLSSMEIQLSLPFTVTGDSETMGMENEFRKTTEVQNLFCDSLKKTYDHTMIIDDTGGWPISSEPYCRSNTDAKLRIGVHEDGALPCNLSDCLKTGDTENNQSANQDGILNGKSEPVHLHCQDSCTFVQDGRSLLVDTSRTYIRIASVETGNQGHLAELGADHEEKNYAPEESNSSAMEGLSKSIIAREGPLLFNGDDSDISMAHAPTVGDSLAVIKETHDSLYEDGELRGSCMYYWEENECVDYESDGMNEDDTYTELAEVGSEADESKSGHDLPTPTPTRKFVFDEFDNNERAGKGSNAGSGTTTEQSMENLEENGYSRNRRLLTNSSDTDFKMGVMNEYTSNVSRRKFQFRREGISPMDTGDANGSISTQSYRSNRHRTPYYQSKRGIYFDKYDYVGQRNYARDGAQWSSWDSRRHRNSDYQFQTDIYNRPNKPRNTGNDHSDQIRSRQDFFNSRQTDNYLTKSLRRPLERRPEKDYAYVRKRSPLTWGASDFRGQVRNLHHADKGFEDFPQSSSRGDRSFSLNSVGSSEIHSLRRPRSKSRSHSPWHQHPMSRRRIPSLDNGSDGRTDRRTRMPFFKTTFGANYNEDYVPTSRRHFPPQDNHRFLDDPEYEENHLKKRRSSARVFREPQRFDRLDAPGELESNEYYRAGFRTRRFTYPSSNTGRKVDAEYADRRRDGGI